MAMSPNACEAFAKLKARGIAVMEWGHEEGYSAETQFVLIHASDDGREKYADTSGKWIRESRVNGQWINPEGIRQDIWEILLAHDLAYEWQDFGQLTIYEEERLKQRPLSESTNNDDPPMMSEAAFAAFLELARIGAPVWDYYSYSDVYDPATLPEGTQFVMTCEPKFGVTFADAADVAPPSYPKTRGLRRDVLSIARKFGLDFCTHTHLYTDTQFPPLGLIAFLDPRVSGRGC